MKLLKSAIEWKYFLLVAFFIFLAALFIRLHNLNLLPVFADEAIYVRWAQIMKEEPSLRFLPLSDGKQPLFMWVNIVMFKIFSDPLVAGRALSAFAGIGTMLGISSLSYLLFRSKNVSLVAAAIYALSPFAVFFDRMALVDSMLSFFGIWSLFLSIIAVKTLRLDIAMLAGFALGGALLTKSPALFFVLLLPSLLLFQLGKKKGRISRIFKAIGLLFVTMVISGAMYNILRLGPNFHLVGSRNLDYVHPFNHFLTSPLNPLISNLLATIDWFWVLGPSALFFLVISGIVRNYRSNTISILVLVVWVLAPIVAQAEFARVFTSRYIFFTLPPIVILAASALSGNKFNLFHKSVIFILAVFVAQSLSFHSIFFKDPVKAGLPEHNGYLSDWTAGTGIRESADIILQIRDQNPNRQIIIGTEGYFGTLPDGLQIYLQGEENIVTIGVGLHLSEAPSQLTDTVKAGNLAFLVINSNRLNMVEPFENYGLRVVAEFEKMPYTTGESDTLYLFEVMP